MEIFKLNEFDKKSNKKSIIIDEPIDDTLLLCKLCNHELYLNDKNYKCTGCGSLTNNNLCS